MMFSVSWLHVSILGLVLLVPGHSHCQIPVPLVGRPIVVIAMDPTSEVGLAEQCRRLEELAGSRLQAAGLTTGSRGRYSIRLYVHEVSGVKASLPDELVLLISLRLDGTATLADWPEMAIPLTIYSDTAVISCSRESRERKVAEAVGKLLTEFLEAYAPHGSQPNPASTAPSKQE